LVLDRLVRRLARARDELTVPAARVAAALQSRRGWRPFGYRNAQDFARERLGRSSRWLRDLAALDEPLQRLPVLARALGGAGGERRLGRVAALCVGRVATSENVESWIDRARGASVRELNEVVRAEQRSTRASSTGGTRPDVFHEDPSEERVRIRAVVPPEVLLCFNAGVEHHRAVSGSETGVAEFIDAQVGEASSVGWAPDVEVRPAERGVEPFSERERALEKSSRRWRALRENAPRGGASTPVQRRAERLLARLEERLREVSRLTRSVDDLPDSGVADTTPAKASAQTAPDAFVPPRARIRALKRIVRVLCDLVRLEDEMECSMGELLLELDERRVWSLLGFGGLAHYADELGWSRSTAARRVAVARGLRRLALVRAAYRAGRIGLEAAHWIVRRARETQPTELAQRLWLAHVDGMTVKRLRDEERLCEVRRLERRCEVARSETARFRRVAKHGRAVSGCSPTPWVPDDATWYRSLKRVPGRTQERVVELGVQLLERVSRRGALLEVVLDVWLPRSLAETYLSCVRVARERCVADAERPLDAGMEVRLRPSERLARAYVERREFVPVWVGMQALVEEYMARCDDPAAMDRSYPFQHVMEESGFRCETPGCTCRRSLHTHHIEYRSDGGGSERTNLAGVCADHHLHGEHGGLLQVRGASPLGLRWRLGCAELAEWFQNERRVKAPEESFDPTLISCADQTACERAAAVARPTALIPRVARS
jgi:hypothetical protein